MTRYLTLLLAVACSSEPTDHAVEPQLACDITAPATYQTHYEERPGGTCGVPFDGPVSMFGPDSPACVVEMTVTDCVVSRSFTCDLGYGLSGSTEQVLHETPTGLAGTSHVVMLLPDKTPHCESTYDVTFTL